MYHFNSVGVSMPNEVARVESTLKFSFCRRFSLYLNEPKGMRNVGISVAQSRSLSSGWMDFLCVIQLYLKAASRTAMYRRLDGRRECASADRQDSMMVGFHRSEI